MRLCLALALPSIRTWLISCFRRAAGPVSSQYCPPGEVVRIEGPPQKWNMTQRKSGQSAQEAAGGRVSRQWKTTECCFVLRSKGEMLEDEIACLERSGK